LQLDTSYVLRVPGYTLVAMGVFALALGLRQREAQSEALTLGGVLVGVLAAFGLLFRFNDGNGSMGTAIVYTREYLRKHQIAVDQLLPHNGEVVLGAGTPELAGLTLTFCIFVVVRHLAMFRLGIQIFDLRSVAIGLLAGLFTIVGIAGGIETYIQNEAISYSGERQSTRGTWMAFRELRSALSGTFAGSQIAFAGGVLFAGVALVAAAQAPGLRFSERRTTRQLILALRQRVGMWGPRTFTATNADDRDVDPPPPSS